MKKFVYVLFFLFQLVFAQNKNIDKLFDERNFSTSSTENELSNHFKKYLNKDFLSNFKWEGNEEYIVVSFELDKDQYIQNFKISLSGGKSKIYYKIKKAFLKFDFSKKKIKKP